MEWLACSSFLSAGSALSTWQLRALHSDGQRTMSTLTQYFSKHSVHCAQHTITIRHQTHVAVGNGTTCTITVDGSLFVRCDHASCLTTLSCAAGRVTSLATPAVIGLVGRVACVLSGFSMLAMPLVDEWSCLSISKLLSAYFLHIMRIFLLTQKIRKLVVCVNKTPSAYFLRIFCILWSTLCVYNA
jgi:hypothetical protein